MMINGTFRFHAVGQGLFYSGLINKKGSGTFSFVYDCGTESSKRFLRREIDDFKALLPHVRNGNKKKIDLLVISHMHDDHVNGLEYLLKDVEVDTVVMPYTDQTIRFLARAESIGDEPFLSSFYMDPVEWFSLNGVHRVMLLGSPNEGQYYNMDGSEEQRYLVIDEVGINPDELVHDTGIVNINNTLGIKHSHFCWKFIFKNLKLPKRDKYRNIVSEFQNEKMMSLEEIFSNKTLRKDLAKRLRGVSPSGRMINRTSVVLIHGPIVKSCDSVIFGDCMKVWKILPIKDIAAKDVENFTEQCINTILTGDIELDKDEDKLLKVTDEDLNFLLQYPHHGSDKALVDINVPRFYYYVFSTGMANRYGHPHAPIMEEPFKSVVVNERNAFDYFVRVSRN